MVKNGVTERTKSKRKYSIAKDVWAWILFLPAVAGMVLFFIKPQIEGITWSFFDMNGYTIGKFCGLDNYIRVIKDSAFLKTFMNTLKYVFCSMIIGYPLPFIIALVMNEMIHFRKVVRTAIYLPGIMPAVAVSLMWYFIYYPDASGMLNTILGKFGMEPYIWLEDGRFTILYIILSMTWSGMGGTAIYYFAAMQGINRELYEAAIIDGAGFCKRIKVVNLPYMRGILLLMAIQQLRGVFCIMEQPMQMTGGGPNNASLSLGLLNYRYGFELYKPQMAMAQGTLMALFLMIFVVLYIKANKKVEEGGI